LAKIRRIPTIIGLITLLAGLGGGVFLVQKAQTFLLRAAPETAPNQIKITNLTDTSFTVSWITDQETVGLIHYGETTHLDLSSADERDQASSKTNLFSTHYVTVKSLKPKTTYYFKIISGSGTYDDDGQPYQITTGSPLNLPPPASDLAYGKIIKQDGQPAEGAIVYLTLANAQPQSALVQESGNWLIPLNLARATDLIVYASYDKDASIEDILVQASKLGTATAVTTTKNDSPVPTITLGENGDFRTAEEETGPPEIKQAELLNQEATEEAEPTPTPASKFSTEPPATSAATLQELAIINPDNEENVNTQKPAILGTGPAGKTIEITIESSTTYTGTVLVDSDGNWHWSPPANLEPGEHTVTASFTDESGEKQTVSHTFVVLAAGEDGAPAIEATPSAEATPTATPTLTPTPVPRTAIPSTEGGVPSSGNMMPTFLVFLIGSALVVLGLSSRLFLRNEA
jgi:hypothetical protein